MSARFSRVAGLGRLFALVCLLAALFLVTGCALVTPPFAQATGKSGELVTVPAAQQPVSPLPPVGAGSIFHHRWRMTEAVYQGARLDTSTLGTVHAAIDPLQISLDAELCSAIWYAADFAEGERYTLARRGAYDYGCRPQDNPQYAALATAFEATDRFVLADGAVVLGGAEAEIRFVLDDLTPPPGEWGLDRPLPPQSLEEVLRHTALIFFGEVGPVERYLEFCGYEADGRVREPCGAEFGTDSLSALPATEFRLHVGKVIRDDGAIARGEPILLREQGYMTGWIKELAQAMDWPPHYSGDRRLFLLQPLPEGGGYALRHGPWGALLLDGDLLRISNRTQDLLEFPGGGGPVTYAMLLDAVGSPETQYVPYIPPAPAPVDAPSVDTPPVDAVKPEYDPVAAHAALTGVSYEEAAQQLRWAEESNVLGRRLRSDPNYVVSWVEFVPEFRYIVRMTNADPAQFAAVYLQGVVWADRVVIEPAEPDAALETRRAWLIEALVQVPEAMTLVNGTEIDLAAGKVRVYTHDPDALRPLVEKALAASPLGMESVELVFRAAP